MIVVRMQAGKAMTRVAKHKETAFLLASLLMCMMSFAWCQPAGSRYPVKEAAVKALSKSPAVDVVPAGAYEGQFHRRPPTGTETTPLADLLKAEIHHIVTLLIGPLECRPIVFTVELTARLDTAVLLIKDACITGIDAGECFVSAQLKYGDLALHDEVESKRVPIPGRFTFKTPLAIAENIPS
jgi:hypothetical protein